MQFYDSKYDMAKNWINQKLTENISWESLNFGMCENEEGLDTFLKTAIPFFGNLSKSEWHALIGNMKEISDESMHFDDLGPVICVNEDQDNELKVRTAPSTSWSHYKKQLETSNFSPEAINEIETTTKRILQRLKFDTEASNPLLGLVIGNVQSGKTANIAALMAMAADNGFNFFLILSGTIDNLREQTKKRLNRDLNSQGCGLIWSGLDSLGSRGSKKITELRLDKFANTRYFYVCLKNPTRLSNFIRWLKKDVSMRKQVKMLIIDDEADQAGINTSNLDSNKRSTINQYIVDIVYNKDEMHHDFETKCKCINYIGYTATPYANILNESPDRCYSLFPRNFVAGLKPSKEYFGPQQIFGDSIFSGLPIVNEITISEYEQIKNIHSGYIYAIPKSLQESICWFYCCFACFRIWKINKPISMLIHTSQSTTHHEYIQSAIINYLNTTDDNNFILECKEVYNSQKGYLTVENFRNYYCSYEGIIDNDYPDFEKIKDIILEIKKLNTQRILMDSSGTLRYSKGVHLCIDNCNYNSKKDVHFRLAYPSKEDMLNFATGFIVIGGATLSRGLTIEGLVSTYFLRTVKQADTLMQMGRWFGYRRHYELLPRIWMTRKVRNKFKLLSLLDTELRNQINLLDLSNQSPSRRGVKIKNTPKNSLMNLTSANKQQDSVFVDQDHTGSESHTTSFFSEREKIENNLTNLSSFINSIIKLPHHIIGPKKLWRNVDYKIVFKFLKEMEIPTLSNNYPEIDQLEEWYNSNYINGKLENFNIVFSGSSKCQFVKINGENFYLVNRSKKIIKMKDNLFRLGVVRDTSDLFLDIDTSNFTENEIKECKLKKLKNLQYLRNKSDLGKTSLLIIYLIDKDSKPENINSITREKLNSYDNLVGIYLSIAGGEKNQNYTASVRVKIKDFDEGDDLNVSN